MANFQMAHTVDCRWCVENKRQRGTARAIPTVVPNSAGAPVQINVMRCLNCDLTPCHACNRKNLTTNRKYCECGALLMPKGKR